MHKKIQIFILSSGGSATRQFSVSKSLLTGFVLLVMAAAAVLGTVVYDYSRLKQKAIRTAAYERQIAQQKSDIVGHRRQIQQFAQDINQLRDKLTVLNDFERKIRIIANLERETGQIDGVFGMGGISPNDLDTQLELNEHHNGLMREMHAQVGQLTGAAQHQTDNFDDLLGQLEQQVTLLACTPAIRPTKGVITSRFGARVSPFTGRREFHKALDIANRKGTPIVAPADGVVSWAGKKSLFGRMVVIDHGHGLVTRYAHLDKALKKRGQKVKRGETIALMGRTGRTTGPHLHYEVHLNGVPVNPSKYILN